MRRRQSRIDMEEEDCHVEQEHRIFGGGENANGAVSEAEAALKEEAKDWRDHGDWMVWQLVDSLLPTGGFAHSFGLECAVQHKFVNNVQQLENYISQTVEQSGAIMLPIIFAAWKSSEAVRRQRPHLASTSADTHERATELVFQEWEPIARFTDILLTNHVANRASLSQGNALLRVACAAFPHLTCLKAVKRKILKSSAGRTAKSSSSESLEISGQEEDGRLGSDGNGINAERPLPIFEVLKTQCQRGEVTSPVKAHHAPIFGLLCGLLGIDATVCQRMYLFYSLRDLLSAATRLNLVGPMESAALLTKLGSTVGERLLREFANKPIEDAHQSNPFLDVIQGMHDGLYTRIFNS